MEQGRLKVLLPVGFVYQSPFFMILRHGRPLLAMRELLQSGKRTAMRGYLARMVVSSVGRRSTKKPARPILQGFSAGRSKLVCICVGFPISPSALRGNRWADLLP